MTATEDVADEVKAKLSKMDPAQRDAAVKKAKVGRAEYMSCMCVGVWVWVRGNSDSVRFH
jgi:hypothetical protein